jgi:hypothetical protein
VIAVSTVDTVGGLLILVGLAVWLIVDGVRACLHPPVDASTASLPSVPRQARRVEAGTFVAAEATCREEVAGCSSRPTSAATAIEALTFPGPYSRIGNRR